METHAIIPIAPANTTKAETLAFLNPVRLMIFFLLCIQRFSLTLFQMLVFEPLKIGSSDWFGKLSCLVFSTSIFQLIHFLLFAVLSAGFLFFPLASSPVANHLFFCYCG